jgi:hypothetical protein
MCKLISLLLSSTNKDSAHNIKVKNIKMDTVGKNCRKNNKEVVVLFCFAEAVQNFEQ